MKDWRRGRRVEPPAPNIPVQPAASVEPGSIVAGGVSGIASTGPGATNVQYQAENVTVLPAEALRAPESVAAPAGLINLPIRPQIFVGRDQELRQLDATVGAHRPVVVQAVHGLGGIGKSTLVARWAEQHRDVYAPVWWITADNRDHVDDGLVAFAVAVQPDLARALPSSALRERAVRWLASHEGWLLILDNVNRPADITDLLARLPRGRIVVTSRRSTGWPDTVTPLRLDVLDLDEAIALLTRIVGRAEAPVDAQDAATLCTELGCLPLAVEQAGAYLAQTRVSVRDYLGMLARYPARMYAEGEEGREAERTVARVWKVTLDALASDPLPGRLLRVLAWYSPEAVPRSLLDGLDEQPAVVTALGRLAAYNMVNLVDGSIVMHRLVQAVTRTPDPEDPHRRPDDITAAYASATVALFGAVPDAWQDPASWPRWRALLPHIDAVAGQTVPDMPDDVREVRAALLNSAGLFVGSQGNTSSALRYHERAQADFQQVYGDDHPSTLTAVTNLAYDYRSAGDLGRATLLFEYSLTHYLRVLGEDHLDTLASMQGLASAYYEKGDLGGAITLYEHVLAGRRRVLGEDHPDVLISVNNLAGAYREAGDLGRALPLFERAMADSQRVLGEDHPDTLSSVNNLAGAYYSAGNLGRALPLFERSLTESRRVLGDEHPKTLAAMNNLGVISVAAGDVFGALPLLSQALTARRRVLGDDHPETLASMNNLAGAYKAVGVFSRAVPLFEQALTARRRVLGDDHPETLASVSNLADVYRSAGKLDLAIPLFEQVLTDRRRLLGEDHPDTMISVNNLGGAYEAAGDPERAIPLFEQVLADCRRVLGSDHPTTLISVNNLAGAYETAGDPGRAVPLYEQALSDCRRLLGNDHPTTSVVAANLRSAQNAL